MSWSLWWIFMTTSVVLDAVPGPAVMLVTAVSLRHGWRAAARTILGILSSNAFYFAISATSLGTLLLESYNVFFLLKWIGAAYLVYLGWKQLRSRASFVGGSAVVSAERLFLNGFVTQIANPKALAYFAAFVPLFLSRDQPVVPQLVILGVTSVFFEFFVLLGYAIAADRASHWMLASRYATAMNRIAGLVLIAAGGGVALLQR